jgi:hypothetical protein
MLEVIIAKQETWLPERFIYLENRPVRSFRLRQSE